ncbi:MAG TPA: pilus assembly protein TadG-related protein [Roseiflexaceae bacterium]|nr:pilus assembly protein TadG-related protein [Roseiflexaceae bacterium]HMP39822.1 pilus assembly protein TadG-related protein [Roseiflexaceae bacterium]
MRTLLTSRRASGQSIVLVALTLLLLVAFSGLGVDGANAFNQRRNATNAADAAALAGTRALIAQKQAGGGAQSAVFAAIEDYLQTHGLENGIDLQWEAFFVDRFAEMGESPVAVSNAGAPVPNSAFGVVVELEYTFGTYFMTVLGRPDLTVDAEATAVYGPLMAAIGGDLIPLAISQQAAQGSNNGDMLCIFGDVNGTCPVGTQAYGVQPGNFGQVSFNPNNAPNTTGNFNQDCIQTPAQHEDSMSRWWCQGSQYALEIGGQLWGDTGMLSNSLAQEMQWRIDNRPVGIVPVFGYSVVGNGNNAQYTIVGFMAVRLDSFSVSGQASSRWVLAERVDYFTTAGAMSSGAVDAGVYAINLVR